MQQMSSILLGSSSKTANAQVAGAMEDTVQSTDNKSFLSVFNQASQSELDKTQIAVKAEVTNENNGESQTEEADVELIFAQIGLAENFDKNAEAEQSGKDLPLEADASKESLLQADTELVLIDETQHSTDKVLLNSELPINDLSNDTDLDSATFLNSLSTEQVSALSQFSSMSEAELAALNPAELNKLISNFNQQQTANNGLTLPLMGLAESNGQRVVNSAVQNLNSESNSAELKAAASGLRGTDKVANASNVSAAQATNAEKVAAENKAISDSKKLDINNTDKETTSINLTKAEINVSLDKPTSKVAFNNALLSSAKDSATNSAINTGSTNMSSINISSLDSMKDSESIDVKALQNQSSFTPQHKSDVPQFQLSLRQGTESAVQMQDMIQKFAPVMKQQLITMVGQGVQHAEIRLDPAELGHMVVKIQVNGEQTQVQFQVAQTQTKDLIEQAIPKLREMLAEEGLQLADSHVSQDGENQKRSEYDEQNSTGDSMLDEIAAQELDIATKHTKSSNSAIDYYA
ncbi:flagellar hook-length control protein FliK [Shewanella olleyana]|uniref:flagellar hook-length control protein FliK n=1 Tax=Shewanella olleyana TaxID=135626 RepID=UPI00200C539C|nr:flagellar hook-length control protein FliK [Shewanella olleyana]MCL1066544.1 flagellar hook-length control protein FliK [Shewanella olleyana]